MTKKCSCQNVRLLAIGAIAVVFAVLVVLACPRLSLAAPRVNGPQKRAQNRRPPKRAAEPRKPSVDYAKFTHQTHVVAQKLECNSCHKVPSKNWKEVRKGDEAFPDVSDFPEHASCLSCHRQQFFARERPAPVICGNCHVKNSPRDTSRFLFPSLGDVTDPARLRREFVSEFGVGFPHDKHIDVVGFYSPSIRRDRGWLVTASFQEKKDDGPPKSCAVCHSTYKPQGDSSEEYVTKPPKNLGDGFWLKKGTFNTIPNSHTVCFTCHNSDSGITPEPKDCNICHKLVMPEPGLQIDFDPKLAKEMGIIDRIMLTSWSRRASAGAFRHEGGEHPALNCMGCHNVASPTFSTLDHKTLKVAVRSCGGADGCHVTFTTDDGGALNFEIDQKKKDPAFVCTKCHVVFGKTAAPESHLKAIPARAPKKPD
ncbi:MAG: cytochrome c3 family protein [Pyrinomonadaceae bacterium]